MYFKYIKTQVYIKTVQDISSYKFRGRERERVNMRERPAERWGRERERRGLKRRGFGGGGGGGGRRERRES